MAPGMRFAFRFASVTGYGLALSESRGQTQGMRVSSGEGVRAMRCKRSKEVAPLESFGRDCYQTAWDGKATSRPPLKIEAVAFELLQWVVNHTSRSSPAQCSSSRQGPVAPTAPPVGRGGGGCLLHTSSAVGGGGVLADGTLQLFAIGGRRRRKELQPKPLTWRPDGSDHFHGMAGCCRLRLPARAAAVGRPVVGAGAGAGCWCGRWGRLLQWRPSGGASWSRQAVSPRLRIVCIYECVNAERCGHCLDTGILNCEVVFVERRPSS